MKVVANTGTHVVEKQEDGEITREPVLFWTEDDHGRAIPVTMDGERNLIGDCGILFPDGWVVTASSSAAVQIDEWTGKKPLAKRQTPIRAENKPAVEPSENALLSFTGKEYKTNSFWHFDDGETIFVVKVEPGTPTPVDENCQKVTRDTFFELRKEVTEHTVEALMAGAPENVTEFADEDEDDIGDMV